LGDRSDGTAGIRPGAAGSPWAVEAEEDDGRLLEAIAQGDHRAFRLLMERHLPRALRVAQRITRNADDADEIAQEAFLKVWTGASRWRPDGQAQFKTWLYRVVVNQCIDRKRRVAPLPLEAAGDPQADEPSSFDQVSAQETARLVSQALDDLPDRQKAAISLCHFGEFSSAEAAKVLDVSVSAIESLLVRGRRALRDRLGSLGALDGKGEKP